MYLIYREIVLSVKEAETAKRKELRISCLKHKIKDWVRCGAEQD